MSKKNINMLGNLGTYVDDNNVLTFQIGGGSASMREPFGVDNYDRRSIFVPQFTNVDGYQVCSRRNDNRSCERIEKDIKRNRLLPRLIDKQIKLLYGKGLTPYKEQIIDGKVKRTWEHIPAITEWLESWGDNGMEMSYTDFALAVIKRFYYFRDFFVKLRMAQGKNIGRYPIAGMELLENKNCRLATKKRDVVTDTVLYNDFRYVLFGDFTKGLGKFKVYPLFNPHYS